MEAFLHSLGRVIEFESCYQVVDIVALNATQLRKLNNWPHEIRKSSNSLTGYELVVWKVDNWQPWAWIGAATALAIAIVV